jgi:hypothetical protein
MGGEWIFSIPRQFDAEKFDLELYRKELKKFKEAAKEQNAFKKDQVEWAVDDKALVKTNIFASFQYSCSRHGSIHDPEGPNWKLYWDPQLAYDQTLRDSNTHARCAPCDFIRNSVLFQRRLAHMFPTVFSFYLGDGESGYDCGIREPLPSTYMGNLKFRSVSRGYDMVSQSESRPARSRAYDDAYDEDRYNETYEEEDDRYNDTYEEEFTPHAGYYRTGNGDTVYALAGEEPDLTACDKECGYCGRCSY